MDTVAFSEFSEEQSGLPKSAINFITDSRSKITNCRATHGRGRLRRTVGRWGRKDGRYEEGRGLDLRLELVLLHYCQLGSVELVFYSLSVLENQTKKLKLVRKYETLKSI